MLAVPMLELFFARRRQYSIMSLVLNLVQLKHIVSYLRDNTRRAKLDGLRACLADFPPTFGLHLNRY